uniref:Uncharacterized protein n=1 Tax=Physcomitrium patens TaxID=3218 RepID=A0A2K1JI09_PHYPA|nr:hypothetical protein PHYPA_018594 [Physcomitrium patens]
MSRLHVVAECVEVESGGRDERRRGGWRVVGRAPHSSCEAVVRVGLVMQQTGCGAGTEKKEWCAMGRRVVGSGVGGWDGERENAGFARRTEADSEDS